MVSAKMAKTLEHIAYFFQDQRPLYLIFFEVTLPTV